MTMKIVTDKLLYSCCIICGLVAVYFLSGYILLALVLLILYLYCFSHTTGFCTNWRYQKQLSNLWNKSLVKYFDIMYQHNGLYRLNRNRTLKNSYGSQANTPSATESDAENTDSIYCSEYESRNFAHRSCDETSFSRGKIRRNREFQMSNRSFCTPSFTRSHSPWGNSVSPKLRNHTSGIKTVQTVAGPLLASTRFNINVDSGLYGNVSSPGLSSRIAHSAFENTKVLIHQKQYDRPGDFPLVQLDHLASKLPALSPRNTHKLSRTSVTIRIAPPESSELRYSALLDRSPQSLGETGHNLSPAADPSTKSVLEVLKEISHKRIHAQMEENEDDMKRQCKETSWTNGEEQSRSTPVQINITSGKRMRDDSPGEMNIEQTQHQQSRKKMYNNEILSSLSSSRNLLKFMKKSASKRKSSVEWSEDNTPVAKKQYQHESPAGSISDSLNASNSTLSSDKPKTSFPAAITTVTCATSTATSTACIAPPVTSNSSITEIDHSANSPGVTKVKNDSKRISGFIAEEQRNQQRLNQILEIIEQGGSKKNIPTRKFSLLSKASSLPLKSIALFSEETSANPKCTAPTSSEPKISDTEVKDSSIALTKSSSSADVFGLVTSLPSTTLPNILATSISSIPSCSNQTSSVLGIDSATSKQNSSPFSNLTSPQQAVSNFNAYLKTSDTPTSNEQSATISSSQIHISSGFEMPTVTSNATAHAFAIGLSPQTTTASNNFGTSQVISTLPISSQSVQTPIFATSIAEQPIQTSGLGTSTTVHSNTTPAVQLSMASSNNGNNAETLKQSSPLQLMFGVESSLKEQSAQATMAFGSSAQMQSTQAATLFSSSQVQSTQATSGFQKSPQGHSTLFSSPQAQSTQASMAFKVPQAPTGFRSPVQAATELGSLPPVQTAQATSVLNIPHTSQQTSVTGMFSTLQPTQSTNIFGTSSLQPIQTVASLGGPLTTQTVDRANVFGSAAPAQATAFKTSSAQVFAVPASSPIQVGAPAVLQSIETNAFAASPLVKTTQAAVFGAPEIAQTTEGSNEFVSSSAASSTQSVVSSATNIQPSTTLQSTSSFGLPSTTIGFGSSPLASQNICGFVIGTSVSEADSGFGASANTASLGFGSTLSNPISTQNTFSFGGVASSPAVSQVTSAFETLPSQIVPKFSTPAPVHFGLSAAPTNAVFATSQNNTVVTGGFGPFSGSSTRDTSNNNNITTGKNVFATVSSPAITNANTSVFGTQSANVSNIFGGTKTDEKPPPFSFGSTKASGTSNVFNANNAPNTGGFKFDFVSSESSKENAAGTSSGQIRSPAFQFGTQAKSKPAFSFGNASNISNTLKPASSNFGSNIFGGVQTTSSSTTPQTNIFAFGGASTPGTNLSGSTGNAFGLGAASSAPTTSSTFTFGNTTQSSSSNVFGFGSTQTTTSATQNPNGGGLLFNTGTGPTFQFGSTSNQTGFSFGSSGSPSTPLSFTTGSSSVPSTFQPGTTGNMFSIGSGSTAPRARASRTRRQR